MRTKVKITGEAGKVEYKEAAGQLPQTVFKTSSAFANARRQDATGPGHGRVIGEKLQVTGGR